MDCCRAREGDERSRRGVSLWGAAVSKESIWAQSSTGRAGNGKFAVDCNVLVVWVGKLRHEQADDFRGAG